MLLAPELAALESLSAHAHSSSDPPHSASAPGAAAANAPEASAAGTQSSVSDLMPPNTNSNTSKQQYEYPLEPLLALHRELVQRFAASRRMSRAYTESGASHRF